MRKTCLLAVLCALALAAGAAAQQGALQTAASTLGVGTIKTLQFTGAGRNFSIGQNYTASEPWPAVPVKSYTATINYDTGAMRVDLLREMGPVMPRGGGAPFFGEQRQMQLVSGNYAWNARRRRPAAMAAAAAGRAARAHAGALVDAAGLREGGDGQQRHDPRGARRHRGVVHDRRQVQDGRDDQRAGPGREGPDLDRPADRRRHARRDDLLRLQGFRRRHVPVAHRPDAGRLPDARHLTISAVTANPMFDAPVPENVRNAPPPPPVMVASQKMADGVYYLTGTSHHSLAIEMNDHIVIVDLPLNEERARAVVAKAKELIPNKPVRYVITSHHHWDHLGGIRTAMDEGATIVTHQSNKAFLERVAKTPHTLVPDRLATSKKAVQDPDRGRRRQADRRHADDRAAPASRATSTPAT